MSILNDHYIHGQSILAINIIPPILPGTAPCGNFKNRLVVNVKSKRCFKLPDRLIPSAVVINSLL